MFVIWDFIKINSKNISLEMERIILSVDNWIAKEKVTNMQKNSLLNV